LALEEGFDKSRVVEFPWQIKVLTYLGWGGVLFSLVSRQNRYFYIIVLLFVSEFFQRISYFSPYSYYYWLLVYLAAICSVPFLKALNDINRLISLIICSGIYIMLWYSASSHYALWEEEQKRFYLPDYITRNISRCDYVFNGNGVMYNIFGKDPAYYWQLIGQLDVIGEKVGIHPKPEINVLIERLKPKFVFGQSYFNKFADEKMHNEIVHYVNPQLLEKYYTPVREGSSIYMLKKEYDERKCVYDTISRQWKYVGEY
jgi:hypothetical protein